MSTWEEEKEKDRKIQREIRDNTDRNADANERNARETGRLAENTGHLANATQDVANAQHRIAGAQEQIADDNHRLTNSEIQVNQSEIQLNREREKAAERVSKAQSYAISKDADTREAAEYAAMTDAGVERVDTGRKNEEDRANIQQIFDVLGDCFSTIDEQGQPNESFDIDPYAAGRPTKKSKLPAPAGTLSARSYANIVAAMTKMRDLRTEIERVRKWDANQSREGTLEKIDDYLERGKAARKSQAVEHFVEREKEHKKWLLINLIAIPICFYGIALCYTGLFGFGVLIWMAFQRIALKPSNQRDLENDAGQLDVKVNDTKALIGQAVLIVGFVLFGASQFWAGDAYEEAQTAKNLTASTPLIENKTPLNPKMKGTWQSTNKASKVLTITPIGISLNEGESSFDYEMAGINCQGDVCKFNTGLDRSKEVENPRAKAYVEGDKLTISGLDFSGSRLNGVWVRSKAKAAPPAPAPTKTTE